MSRLPRAALALVALAFASAASAQTFPSKPLRIIVPQAPGGASDALARVMAQKLGERWGQSVVVENRAGAGGNIGTDAVAKSAPDGYTLLMSYAGTQAINPSLYKSLPFDAVKDFSTVATLAVVPFLMAVNPNVKAANVREFVALAKASPGTLGYGSAGNGSVNHLLGEMFNGAAGVKLVHVPYKGAAQAMTDLLANQVQVVFTSVPSVVQHVRTGSLRALAVTSAKRSAALPDVPTLAEAGLAGFDVTPWFGLLAPANVPAPIVRQINAAVNELLATKDVQDRFAGQGAEPYPTTPEQFLAILKSDIEKWAVVVRESGAKID